MTSSKRKTVSGVGLGRMVPARRAASSGTTGGGYARDEAIGQLRQDPVQRQALCGRRRKLAQCVLTAAQRVQADGALEVVLYGVAAVPSPPDDLDLLVRDRGLIARQVAGDFGL